jgi:hypothetical protein
MWLRNVSATLQSKGGEAFPVAELRAVLHSNESLRGARLYNIYGTTEVSCWALGGYVDELVYGA